MKLKKFEGNPVVSPNPANAWEELVTCNPGVIYDNGLFHMLYRAAGDDKEHVIRLGYATSKDGFNFERQSDEPVFSPSIDGPDSGCVEDPRIVKFDDTFYVTYAYRPFAPGQYWKFAHDEVLLPPCGPAAPACYAKSLGNTAMAMTKDFKNFKRLGRLTSPVLDDRDVILFPEKVKDQFVLLHRPKQYIGAKYGVAEPSMWIKFSDDMMCWEDKESHLLITGRPDSWEEKIGGSTPPLRTDKGWLVIYHGVEKGGLGYYRVGALLLDLEDPLKIIARTPDPIMEPEESWEIEGYYNGCVFPTGNVILDDTLYVYYGGADKYVGVATASVSELLDFMLAECKL